MVGWWHSTPHGKGEHSTTLPTPRQPSSAPSCLIHLTAPSHRLVHPFHNFKARLHPLPLGRSCPSQDHTDIHMLFRVIWQPRSALNLHSHSLRRSFFFHFSLFFVLLLSYAAHCTQGSELLISWRSGAITCWKTESGANEQEHSRQDFWINTVVASDKLASTTGYPCNPVENTLIL